MIIPFNKYHMTGKEFGYITGALELAAILASVGPSNEVTAALG